MTEADWDLIKSIFCELRIMKSGTRIVGHSKVMAHLIPNIVPPIDREYTLRFLNEKITNGIEHEWPLMRKVIEKLFIPVAKDKGFISKATEWVGNQEQFPWDNSAFKIIDNLIIAAVSKERSR